MKKLLLPLGLLLVLPLFGQSNTEIKGQVRASIESLRKFIAIPNDASDAANINRNISWLTKEFKERGFNTARLETSGRPLFFAALPVVDSLPTLLFYMHFDGQPVDATKWEQNSPYEMVLKKKAGDTWQKMEWHEMDEDFDYNWRLFGRSVSDDKGPIIMFLHAIDLLKKNNRPFAFNIKVVLDGEEEKGSKPLPKAIDNYKELLEADLLLINDGPLHASGQPTLVFGCRGITTLSLNTYGPVKPQHSGHYGNYAPNPAFQMAQLLASFKDDDGKVLVKGYYDGIEINNEVQKVLAAVPEDEETFKKYLGVGRVEKVGNFYQESLQYPSLNIRGMASGWTGTAARTIIPDKATAEIDIRLVPESDGERLKNLIKSHIRNQGYHILYDDPTAEDRLKFERLITITERPVTPAFRTDLFHPKALWLEQLLKEEFGAEPVKIRIMGGTVPIAPFVHKLKVPALIIPLVNHDNNQHSPNENLRIGQIDYGLRAFYRILSSPFD